jgi:hypothetical protein
MSSSCDGIGIIEVVLTHFRDDRTPVEKLGYRSRRCLFDGSPAADSPVVRASSLSVLGRRGQ